MNLELKCRMPNGNLSSFYFRYGQLESKTLGGKAAPVATLKYLYRKDGMIAGRVVDGKYQMYTYDRRGQLLQVADMQGNVAEKYVYDPAGNILSKTIAGKTTSYTYDKANQLVSSVYDGKTTHYEYDAAGRLIKEDDKSYAYGWLDKVLAVRENDKKIASFDYQVDGQIAQSIHGDQSEAFFWDGLALIHRGETSFINEPYVTGGNPILSSEQGVMFTDMLGSTLNIGGKAIHMTAFGESSDTNAMFTGKPYIGELGYAFLFRNYRADQGKWQTTDPLGYPDGWNNLAYVNNSIATHIDWQGGKWVLVSDNIDTLEPQPPAPTPWKTGRLTPGSEWRIRHDYIITNLVITPVSIDETELYRTVIRLYTYTITDISYTEYRDENGNIRIDDSTTVSDRIVIAVQRIQRYEQE